MNQIRPNNEFAIFSRNLQDNDARSSTEFSDTNPKTRKYSSSFTCPHSRVSETSYPISKEEDANRSIMSFNSIDENKRYDQYVQSVINRQPFTYQYPTQHQIQS